MIARRSVSVGYVKGLIIYVQNWFRESLAKVK
jgi:hypothetical protein